MIPAVAQRRLTLAGATLLVLALWIPAAAKIALTLLIFFLLSAPPAWALWIMAGTLCREVRR